MKKDKVISWISKYACIVFLVITIVIAGTISDAFFGISNITNLLKQGSVLCILAIGAGFVLISGCIDLSIGAIMAISACIAITSFNAIGTLPAIALAIIVSVAISCINMFIIKSSRARALEIMMITFGMKLVYRGIAQEVTGNKVFRYTESGLFSFLGKGMIADGIPVIAIIMVIVAIIAGVILDKTRFGREVVYVGSNTEAARLEGINVVKIRWICFVISGICCGIAGVLLASRTGAVKALSGDNWEINAICALAIGGYSMTGGFGSVWRCVVGTYVFTIISNILNLVGANAFIQIVVEGSIMILAVWVDVSMRAKYKRGNIV